MTKRNARFEAVEMTIDDAIGEAFSEIEALTEEMEQWRDDIHEKASEPSEYADVSAVVDELSAIQAPVIPGEVGGLRVIVLRRLPSDGNGSRTERRDDACAALDAVISELDGIDEDDPRQEPADQLRDDLDQVKCRVEDVAFPGTGP
jgi:hypothetical protein